MRYIQIIRFCHICQRLVHVGLHGVISIRKGHVLAASHCQASIARTGYATVWLVNDPNVRIALRVVVSLFTGVIGGTIINDDDFK